MMMYISCDINLIAQNDIHLLYSELYILQKKKLTLILELRNLYRGVAFFTTRPYKINGQFQVSRSIFVDNFVCLAKDYRRV